MRILITGGAGFIGANLTIALEAAGHHVVVLDNLSPQIHGQDPARSPLVEKIRGKCELIQGSVRDPEAVRRGISGCEAVVHLAAETGTGQSMYEIARYCEVNVVGTALLLETAQRTDSVAKVVVASSRAIHGEGKYLLDGLAVYPRQRSESDLAKGLFEPRSNVCGRVLDPVATDEESLVHPSSIYGITKQNQEQMVLLSCGAAGIGATALRFQNVYGPGQSLSNPYTGILSIFSTRILNGNGIDVYEDGLESRDFIYIDDVVDSIILALSSDRANGEAFIIGSGVPTTVLQVAHVLAEGYGANVPIRVTGAYRVGDIRHNFADPTKSKALLGFAAKVPFEEGARRFADWVLTQPRLPDRYDASVEELSSRGLYK